MLLNSPDQLTLFAEVSPARISPSLDEPRGLTVKNPPSGSQCSKLFKWRSQDMSSSKIRPPFALVDYIESSKDFPAQGMMQSGTIYPLGSLARITKEIASGLLPTPLASETGFRRKRFPQGGMPLALAIGGIPHPEFLENMMLFPEGWTDTTRSAMQLSR